MVKKIKFKQQFATAFRRLTNKIMILVYRSTFSVYMTVLAPVHEFDGTL